jgi:nucleoside-diphosphate-sugar epimerase
MASRILITGVNGYVGGHVASVLLAQGHSILGISLDGTSRLQHPALLQSERVDSVVHLAALVHVRDARLTFSDYVRVNYRASENLFRHATFAGVARIVFSSTVEVYGPIAEGERVSENHPCKPESDYARTKLLAEESLRSICTEKQIAHAILRLGPVYGSDFRLNFDKRLYLKPPKIGFRFGTGDCRLNFCSIRNIEAWVERWLSMQQPESGIFNLADGDAHRVRDLLKLEQAHGRAHWVMPLVMPPCLLALAGRELLFAALGRDPGMFTAANLRKLSNSVQWDTARACNAVGSLPGNIKRDLYED